MDPAIPNGERNGRGQTRREWLASTALAAGGLMLGPELRASEARKKEPRAKSVIQIWMWGGPCHIDTFDPKPNAGSDYTGPLSSPIKTNQTGISIGQLLPNLAKQADKYSLIRSMTHGVNGHETASYLVQTGHKSAGGIVFPCVGAVVSRFRGYDAGFEGLIPPYIVLTQPQGRFSEAGFMGSRYKPFATGGNPAADPFVVEGIVAQGITKARQQSRRDLLHALDTFGESLRGTMDLSALREAEDKAYSLILGDAGRVFDLHEEKPATREAYGRSGFGQSCLLARRLVEKGIPYITINYQGWDTHKNHFQIMQRKLPEMDKAMAALLQDLSDRGLLDSTIVWWTGEFGRTPRVLWDSPWNGGRSHYGQVFSALVAGGGFQGGRVVGASDARGEAVADRPVHPVDLIGTMYDLLGIDTEAILPHPQGLKFPVLAKVDKDDLSGGRLKELL
ncbi:MAG: DUF1501 domain-containing protein [Planctomycetota bacterium]